MTGIIILAAGSSSRMGEAKQNLEYKGQTLLQTAINTAVICAEKVAVVLGANAGQIKSTVAHSPVHIFINENWERGMGSTISYGLKMLLQLYPDLKTVLFLLSDQPLINADAINTIIAHQGEGKIVASAYNDTVGPPVLFDKIFFADIIAMKGAEGAKKVISKHPEAIISVPLEAGAFDIDTPQDYQRLKKSD